MPCRGVVSAAHASSRHPRETVTVVPLLGPEAVKVQAELLPVVLLHDELPIHLLDVAQGFGIYEGRVAGFALCPCPGKVQDGNLCRHPVVLCIPICCLCHPAAAAGPAEPVS